MRFRKKTRICNFRRASRFFFIRKNTALILFAAATSS